MKHKTVWSVVSTALACTMVVSALTACGGKPGDDEETKYTVTYVGGDMGGVLRLLRASMRKEKPSRSRRTRLRAKRIPLRAGTTARRTMPRAQPIPCPRRT